MLADTAYEMPSPSEPNMRDELKLADEPPGPQKLWLAALKRRFWL